jgi:hypothetical protein
LPQKVRASETRSVTSFVLLSGWPTQAAMIRPALEMTDTKFHTARDRVMGSSSEGRPHGRSARGAVG